MQILILIAIGFLILLWFLGQIRKVERQENKMEEVSNDNNKIYEFGNLLENLLDNIYKFINAYQNCMPDEWVHMFMAFETEKENYTNSYTHYLKIKILVGNWWNGIMYQYPEIVDYMFSIFDYDDNEKQFTYRMSIGSSASCNISASLKRKFYEILGEYEKRNPEIKLSKENYGAKYSRNV